MAFKGPWTANVNTETGRWAAGDLSFDVVPGDTITTDFFVVFSGGIGLLSVASAEEITHFKIPIVLHSVQFRSEEDFVIGPAGEE